MEYVLNHKDKEKVAGIILRSSKEELSLYAGKEELEERLQEFLPLKEKSDKNEEVIISE